MSTDKKKGRALQPLEENYRALIIKFHLSLMEVKGTRHSVRSKNTKSLNYKYFSLTFLKIILSCKS